MKNLGNYRLEYTPNSYIEYLGASQRNSTNVNGRKIVRTFEYFPLLMEQNNVKCSLFDKYHACVDPHLYAGMQTCLHRFNRVLRVSCMTAFRVLNAANTTDIQFGNRTCNYLI